MNAGASLAGQAVLVTGASGFIGRHVVRRLVSDGAVVHAFGRSMPNATDPDVRWWHGDVADYPSVHAAVAGARPELVVHLAADTGVRRFAAWDAVERSVAVNLGGTLNVVRAAREAGAPVGRVVRVGGLEEYGDAPTPYQEDARERPISPYSASQVAATYYCQMLQRSTDATLVTLRPALVYGPGQSTDFFIPALVECCLRDAEFAMSDGAQCRDLLYVDDLVDAILAAATADGLRGAVVNVASGVEHPMRDVAEAVVRLVGTGRLRLGALPRRPDDLAHLVAATDRADALLGWRARTPLHEGLARTVAWHRARHAEAVA